MESFIVLVVCSLGWSYCDMLHTMKQYTRLFIILGLAIIGVSFVIYLNVPHTTAVSDITTSPLTVSTAKSGQISQHTPLQTAPQPPTVSELLTLVNAERAKNGVAPLVEDARLDTSAQMKADEMTRDNNNSHVEANGMHGYEYINQVSIYCKTDSENIYWGNSSIYPSTSEGAVYWWIQSKPHHLAMINKDYKLTGFGVSGYRVVEHFCQQ